VNVKTAVSLDADLFEQAETAARELKVSRSRLFALAVEEFLRRRENQRLIDAIDATCDEDEPAAAEGIAIRAGRRRLQRRALRGEW
jgi:metal-responsive CopG/Arc/MetJ family transcriptional regulator